MGFLGSFFGSKAGRNEENKGLFGALLHDPNAKAFSDKYFEDGFKRVTWNREKIRAIAHGVSTDLDPHNFPDAFAELQKSSKVLIAFTDWRVIIASATSGRFNSFTGSDENITFWEKDGRNLVTLSHGENKKPDYSVSRRTYQIPKSAWQNLHKTNLFSMPQDREDTFIVISTSQDSQFEDIIKIHATCGACLSVWPTSPNSPRDEECLFCLRSINDYREAETK